MRKSRPAASTGIAPTDCAPSTSTGIPVSSRSSRTGSTRPVVQSTCDSASSRVRGVTAARIASGSGCDDDDPGAGGAERPSRPKCSSVVVTISSSGPRPSPASTMLQPSVVLDVSATWSGSARDERSEASAHRLAQLQHAHEVRHAAAALVEVALELAPHRLARSPSRAARTSRR